MESDNYVVIQGWMCNELNLKGNDLLVFAMIHGFSQDGESMFSGSRRYIANTFNISLPTVDKALKNLLDRGLIEQYKIERNGIVFNNYKTLYPVKKLYRGSKETLHNNIDNIDSNKNSNSKELELQNSEKPKFEFGKSKTRQPSLYTKCASLIDDYVNQHNCGTPVRRKLIEYLNFRLSVKDKPLYTNMWKGMLSKLDALHKEGYGYVTIIDYCIERGYLSFYPPANCYTGTNKKAWDDGVSCEQYTEEELQKLDAMQKDMESKGMRTKF